MSFLICQFLHSAVAFHSARPGLDLMDTQATMYLWLTDSTQTTVKQSSKPELVPTGLRVGAQSNQWPHLHGDLHCIAPVSWYLPAPAFSKWAPRSTISNIWCFHFPPDNQTSNLYDLSQNDKLGELDSPGNVNEKKKKKRIGSMC